MIPTFEDDEYKLFYKKSNNPVFVNKSPIVLVPNTESNLFKSDIKGGEYILKGEKQQYYLWINKINQAEFSYKINNINN
ncbi:hypothetical protein GCM10019994_39290 [Enterococcus raffinosus]